MSNEWINQRRENDKMKTEYKYFYFEKEINTKKKTDTWRCINKFQGVVLGVVKWNAPWRQYCFFISDGLLIFSSGFLKDISDFLDHVNNKIG
jgi:hypothetical protein